MALVRYTHTHTHTHARTHIHTHTHKHTHTQGALLETEAVVGLVLQGLCDFFGKPFTPV
jgi:hypothetical protein